jgi:hypothetical protein
MTDREGYTEMLEMLTVTTGVLTSAPIHPAIPTIHQVGHREGCRLRCDTEVRHAGWGLFLADVGGKKFSFDGGGAMRRAETFSWSPLRFDAPGLVDLGYDLVAVRKALEELLA